MPQVYFPHSIVHICPSLDRIFVRMGDNAKVFIRKIGQRVKENSGEPRSTSFLIQRLALDVQKGNATSVLGTIPASRDWSEVGLLPT